MSEKKLDSQNQSQAGSSNNPFSNNEVNQRPGPSSNPATRQHNNESNFTNNKSKRLSFWEGQDDVLEFEEYSGEASKKNSSSAAASGENISRDREMSEGAPNQGRVPQSRQESIAQSEMARNMPRQMSEGATGQGRGVPQSRQESLAQSEMSEMPRNMPRQFSEGAESQGRVPQSRQESIAQSEMARNMPRQFSEGAGSQYRGVPQSRQESIAQSEMARNMPRQFSEGAANQYRSVPQSRQESIAQSEMSEMPRNMPRQYSEGAASQYRSVPQSRQESIAQSEMARNMPRQFSEGAANQYRSVPQSRQESIALSEMGRNMMNRQMSEVASRMDALAEERESEIRSENPYQTQPALMERQMSEGATALRRQDSKGAGVGGDQPGFSSTYLNKAFSSEGKSNPDFLPNATGNEAPLQCPEGTIPMFASMMPLGPPYCAVDAALPQMKSPYNEENSSMKIQRDQLPAVAETKEDKEWVSKFERFTVKFLNKIFRRALVERKMKEAVKAPECKNNLNLHPAIQQQMNPYYPNPPNPPPSAVPGQQEQLFPPPPPVPFVPSQSNNQPGLSEEAEEAKIISELNEMLNDISKDVKKISPEYLVLVTPLFGTLVELKGKDFRKTDNREIFRKVDDYHALIKCDTHVCLESVMSRLRSLVDFINVIKADSDNLKKFPKIITKCYETDSKICQEVCEVYSDDDFQTVNIKKMCKLKPKPSERPPWRLTYKLGDECFGSGKIAANTCSGTASSAKACGSGRAKGKCKSRFSTCNNSPCCSSLGSKAVIPRYYSTYGKNSPCPCGCCDSVDEVPNICGIYFTRFRDPKEEDCPLMIEGLPTNEVFPSFTNINNRRELNIPGQKLFLQEPKCYNPPPVQDVCFGGKGPKWKKKFPCGGRNACCKEPCRAQYDFRSCYGQPRRRKRRSCSKKRRKCSALAECQTSEFELPPPNPPPGGDGGPAPSGDMSTLTPEEFTAKMVDMFGKAVQQGESAFGKNKGVNAQAVADLARGVFGDGGLSQQGNGYTMNGMVATQTMIPPGVRQPQYSAQPQQNYIVQMVQEVRQDLPQRMLSSGKQTQCSRCQSKTRCPTRACSNKQAQTFPPCRKRFGDQLFQSKMTMEQQCSDSPSVTTMGNNSMQSCQSTLPQPLNNNTQSDKKLAKNLEMSNNQLAGLLARMMHPPRPPTNHASSSQDVFTNFVAQMYAAGNISRDDASRMATLISSGFPLRRQDDGEGGGGGGGGSRTQGLPTSASLLQPPPTASGSRPLSATKGAQCTISKIEKMTASQYQLNCVQSTKSVHICGPEEGCPSSRSLNQGMASASQPMDGAAPTSLFTTTQLFTSPSGTQLQHTRSYTGANGAFSQSTLCVTTSKPSVQGIPRCGAPQPIRSRVPSRSHFHSRSRTCLTKSKPSMVGVSRCPSRRMPSRNVCVTKSQPSCAGFPRCPSATPSRPACTTKSKPNLPGVYRCKTKPVCTTKSQPSTPGMQRCVPALPMSDTDLNPEPEPGDDGPDKDGGNGPEPPPSGQDDIPPKDKEPSPPASVKEIPVDDGDGGPNSPKTSVLTPKSDKTPPKSDHNTPDAERERTPPMSDSPSLPGSPQKSLSPERTPSPKSEKSASISSKTPSLPPDKDNNNEDETTEEELEWPSTPPRGPLDKVPSPDPPALSGPPRKFIPGKNYHSPFKFQKVRPPEPPCETVLCDLPDCHPLKTPYPPQYRFDEVRMRRYMEQCHQLKKICAHPPGEQCWTPPPPPLPPELRERKPPFPPDRCHPPLFPGTNLGMGCSHGLPSGNCYGQYEKGRQGKKPEDCFFDCGGICPMGMLGETCPQQPPPYSKLKKKTKKDEVFQFDYITVMREKAGPPEPEGDHCDQLKRQRRLQEKERMDAMAAQEQCRLEEQSGCPYGRGRRRRLRKSRGGACMPENPYEAPLPPEEIARFLDRPDVQVVKEQKTEIVKKQGHEGPERMVTQTEAFYTKTPEGRIATQMKDVASTNNNNPKAGTVEQWIKQDADATLRKHNRGHRFTDECPVLETEWEKEFKEFARSCGRSNVKGRQKPLPPGFIPCPLPERTTIMCRIPDPNSMSPEGGNVIQCQAVPIPTGNVGNALHFGTEGVCVGDRGQAGANAIAGLSFMAPPGGYGGYVLQQPMQQQPIFAQGLPPSPQQNQQAYQALISGFPGGVLPPPPSSSQPQQYPQQGNSQSRPLNQSGSQPQSYQQQMYSQSNPLNQAGSQPQQQMNSLSRPLNQSGSQPQSYQQQMYSQSNPLNQSGSMPQQYQQQMYSPAQPLSQVGSQPQQQQMYSLSRPLNQSGSQPQQQPPLPNGYQRYSPEQPIYGTERVTSNSGNVQVQPQKSQEAQRQADAPTDYPYMCEIRYHEPIHGSIYGRVVTRKQPCRLMNPNMVIPPGHNPNCPVIMETPFFNPSCRQQNPNPPQPQLQPDTQQEIRKNQ